MKLSELKDDEVLLINNELVLTKKQFLEDFHTQEDREGCEVYTTTGYTASLNAKDVLYDALEGESTNMYDNWLDDIHKNITEEDLKDIQIVLDRILERSKDHNVSYCADQEVEIDFEEETDNV